jgi:hypothetical protein
MSNPRRRILNPAESRAGAEFLRCRAEHNRQNPRLKKQRVIFSEKTLQLFGLDRERTRKDATLPNNQSTYENEYSLSESRSGYTG